MLLSKCIIPEGLALPEKFGALLGFQAFSEHSLLLLPVVSEPGRGFFLEEFGRDRWAANQAI